MSKKEESISGDNVLSPAIVSVIAAAIKPALFNEFIDLCHPVPGSQLVANLTKEIEQYLKTGNSGPQDDSAAKCVNPTFVQSKTGKWLVHDASCPFVRYAPLPLKELDRSGEHNGIAFEYCRAKLKKLLIAFKKRKETSTFHFHPCDPLAFCYQDSPLQFDIIDGSSFLADSVGLANLLIATAQKLRTHQSVLFTENKLWPLFAPDVVGYLKKMLFCPLSLIPTIYGMRLIDNVELGPDTLNTSTLHAHRPFSRLRWKKAQPYEGVSLAMSPLLEQCLDQLKKMCFVVEAPSDDAVDKLSSYFSPFTFYYVMSDLIRRGGLPASTIDFNPPPQLRTSLEAIQAWMEERPVWRVNVRLVHDTEKKQPVYTELFEQIGIVALRFVLLPKNAFVDTCVADPDRLQSLHPDSHYIDNFELKMNLKTDGRIEKVDLSFLLTDRNMLKSHIGIFFDRDFRTSIFGLGRLGRESKFEVKKFTQPRPWTLGEESSRSAASAEPLSSVRLKKLMPISCQESKDAFTIRIKSQPSGDKLTRPG